MSAKDRDARPNARRRTLFSFALTCALYLPLLGLALWQFPSLAFTAAGQNSTVSLSFAQISGASAENSAQKANAPDKIAPKTERVSETEPKPVAEAPKPKLKPQQEVKPVKKVVKARKNPAAEPPVRSLKKEARQQEKPTDLTPATSTQTGAPTSGSEAGIATLIHGETHDPFLAEVKRRVENHVTYPRRARMLRMQGKTVVEFVVDLDGSLRDLRLFASSGHKPLDQAVLKAIERAQRDWGQPGRIVRLRFPIVFQLRG